MVAVGCGWLRSVVDVVVVINVVDLVQVTPLVIRHLLIKIKWPLLREVDDAHGEQLPIAPIILEATT